MQTPKLNSCDHENIAREPTKLPVLAKPVDVECAFLLVVSLLCSVFVQFHCPFSESIVKGFDEQFSEGLNEGGNVGSISHCGTNDFPTNV